MNNQPLISVVTITYNAATVLAPTMESVAAQTFTDFEHIIIDGASSDATLAVARASASPGLRILSEPDKGLYDAMNKGLGMARGRYVIFLNAGDAFHDAGTLRAYADGIASCPEGADIVYGDTDIVDTERRRVGARHLSVPERLTFESFSHGMLVCHQSFMVRREIAPLYDTSYRFSADYDWTVKCIASSRTERNVNLHRVVTDYLSDGLTDRNKISSLRERYRIMGRHYGRMTALSRHLSFIPRALARKFR